MKRLNPETHFDRVVNLSKVLMCITFALLLLASYLFIQVRVLGDKAFERCVATARASVAASEARKVEIVEFRRLGTLTNASKAFSAAEKRDRDDAYTNMANALQRAVNVTLRPEDCEVYR